MIDPDRVEELISELEGHGARNGQAMPGPTDGRPRSERSPLDDELGEEAELRRALDVVDELIELRPDDLDLRARRLRYLRRLGAEGDRTDEERRLAEELANRGSWRAARLLCRLVLARRPQDSRTRELLSSLPAVDGPHLPERTGRINGDGGGEEPFSEGSIREMAWRELETRVEALPWLCRAKRKLDDGHEGPDAIRDYARYLMIRGRTDEACRLLASELESSPPGADGTEVGTDLRTDLVECLLEAGRRDEAREQLRQLARWDEAFSVVWSAVK